MTETMNRRVLVLNSGWVPIDVASVYDVIVMAVRGRCQFIDPETYTMYDFESWIGNWADATDYARIEMNFISSPSVSVRVPEIAVLRDYSGFGTGKRNGQPKMSRRNIYYRDKNICQYCGQKFRTEDLNLDHVIPKSKGGEMTWQNIVCSCIPCNDKKRNRTPAQAGMRLVRQPKPPSPEDMKRPFGQKLKRKLGKNVPQTWEQFLGKMYWEVGLED